MEIPGAEEVPMPKFLAFRGADVDESTVLPSVPSSASSAASVVPELPHLQPRADNSSAGNSQSGHTALSLSNPQPLILAYAPRIGPPGTIRDVVTVIVKELPSYFTRDMLLCEMNAAGFKCKFDLLYVPYSIERCGNLGFAIVNFTQPKYARKFYLSFHNGCLDEMIKTSQRLVVEPAALQGYEANYSRYALHWCGKAPLGRSQLRPDMLPDAGTDAMVFQ